MGAGGATYGANSVNHQVSRVAWCTLECLSLLLLPLLLLPLLLLMSNATAVSSFALLLNVFKHQVFSTSGQRQHLGDVGV